MARKKQKERDLENLGINVIKVTSRRSVQISRNDFVTFEVTLEATAKDNIDEQTNDLWLAAHNEVDLQITGAINDLVKKKEEA